MKCNRENNNNNNVVRKNVNIQIKSIIKCSVKKEQFKK